MIPTTVTLSLLLGLAAASPLTSRQVKPNYPETSKSKAFHLVVNATDPSDDLAQAVRNTYISSIHVGAGLALIGLNSDSGRIFYQNGTEMEREGAKATVITDTGSPAYPSGFKVIKDSGEHLSSGSLDIGNGTPGIQLSSFPEPYRFLLPNRYVACNESIAYYQGKHFITIKQAESSFDEIPDNCTPVRLLPQCTELNDLPESSFSSHQFVLESDCYDNVAELDWSEYGPN